MKLRWRFGIVAAFFLAIFSLYPQLKLMYLRGDEWQGHYAYNDIDEVAYASYVKALIDGRPRKNDPYTGNDDSAETPQPESLFSIQFAAPYTLAVPARVFGISTPWMMTIGGSLAAALTAMAAFWLLFQLSGNNLFAMAGSLATLAGGAVFAGEGAASEVFFDGFSYPYFPGFRRYIPALAMPVFFALLCFVWQMIAPGKGTNKTEAEERASNFRSVFSELRWIGLALLAFAYVVFSYFYIWTMAAAWLISLAIVCFVMRPNAYSGQLWGFIILAIGGGIVLVPYAYLLSLRSHMMDDVQLLVETRVPDFARFPEYIAAAVLVIMGVAAWRRTIELRAAPTLFVLSMALSIFAVFNQQVITGKSLQPIHYQVFIGNYVSGLALMSAIALLVRSRKWGSERPARLAFGGLALIAIIWGVVECHYTVRVLDDVNIARDEQMPLGHRLTELAADDPKKFGTVVLHFGIAEADDLPTIAPQATLWSRHQHVFTTISHQENKERYYQYLYYQGVTGQQLASSMKRGDFVSMIALFGWGRHTDRLNVNFMPLTYGEIDAEGRNYDDYVARFDPRRVPETIISYLVARTGEEPDLSNFDRWYDRENAEQHGPFILYHTRLKVGSVHDP